MIPSLDGEDGGITRLVEAVRRRSVSFGYRAASETGQEGTCTVFWNFSAALPTTETYVFVAFVEILAYSRGERI